MLNPLLPAESATTPLPSPLPEQHTTETAASPSMDASKLVVTLSEELLPLPTASQCSTKSHTDHLLTINWSFQDGWSTPQIEPYRALSLPPTASVLHYATSCFEGTRLYRGFDGKLRLFRARENCQRMLDSAARVSLPMFDPEEFLKLLKELCRIEGQRWLPSDASRGGHLYVRPTMIGVDADLGFHVPMEALLYVVITYWPIAADPAASLGGPPRSTGLRLLASMGDTVRSWPGGSGDKKISANYAPTLPAHAMAQRQGFDQVLWLYGSQRLVTEAGGTNFFVMWKSRAGRVELVTASLAGGLILPGITRRSILELARARFRTNAQWPLGGETVEAVSTDVVETDFTITDLIEAEEEKRLLAAFAVGTAYFVKPVTEIHHGGRSIHIGADTMPHAGLLRQWLSDIMYGVEDIGWTEVVHS